MNKPTDDFGFSIRTEGWSTVALIAALLLAVIFLVVTAGYKNIQRERLCEEHCKAGESYRVHHTRCLCGEAAEK